MLVAFAAPVLAAPGGNSAASAACEDGGYLDYTRTDGTAFRNEGACVRYSAQGGVLVPVVVGPFSVTYSSIGTNAFRAVIDGTGLEPNSLVTIHFVWPGRSVHISGPAVAADATGNFTFTHEEQCDDVDGNGMTSLTVTGTPAGGSETAYSLEVPDSSICP
jgi:hypothetical protein